MQNNAKTEIGYVYVVGNEDLKLVRIGQHKNPEQFIARMNKVAGFEITEQKISQACFNYDEIVQALNEELSAYEKTGKWYKNISFETVSALFDKQSFQTTSSQPFFTLLFDGQSFPVIHEEGESWLTCDSIGEALEYETPRKSVLKIYQQHREELDEHSLKIKMTTDSGVRQERVFNDIGVMTLIMLSQQPKARELRKEAVQLLKAYRLKQLESTTELLESASDDPLNGIVNYVTQQTRLALSAVSKEQFDDKDEELIKTKVDFAVQQLKLALTPLSSKHSHDDLVSYKELVILNQVYRFFTDNFDRFLELDLVNKSDILPSDLAGFKDSLEKKGVTDFYVFPEVLNQDMSAGKKPKVIKQTCNEHGLLNPDPKDKGNTTAINKRLPPEYKAQRVYHFRIALDKAIKST
jgi:prophage antirepressor-like protein